MPLHRALGDMPVIASQIASLEERFCDLGKRAKALRASPDPQAVLDYDAVITEADEVLNLYLSISAEVKTI